MAFGGFFDSVGSAGSFLPIVKYDARSGRIMRRDRENGENTDVDITKSFKAIFDLENVEIGWLNFPMGSAPQIHMVRYADGVSIDKPEGDGFKRGVRFIVKLSKDCGGDVREMMSNAGAFLDGTKALMEAYERGVKENPGKLPVVAFHDSIAKTSTGGALKTTNYVPVWEITGWVKRPDDLVYSARSSSAPASSNGPASTGSTKVSAPEANEDDFG